LNPTLGREGKMTQQDDKSPRKPRSSLTKAIGFLTDTIEQIFADGKITAEGRKDLYKAIETILPSGKKEEFAEYNFKVAHYSWCGRPEIISMYAKQGDDVLFHRDWNNEHSHSAVKILLSNGMQIGWVPRTLAPRVAHLLTNGYRYRASIREHETPAINAKFYRPNDNVEGAITELQGILSISAQNR
jgi:hypothetical protein